jgi:hypothetical protein
MLTPPSAIWKVLRQVFTPDQSRLDVVDLDFVGAAERPA